MAVYLVTGGAGFIGSHLVEELVRRGEQVRVLDDFSTGKRKNLEPFLDHLELIEGDIRDSHIVRDAVSGVDYVLHQAAKLPIRDMEDDLLAIYEINVGGTTNILYASREAGVRRLVYASSFLIYGTGVPVREDMEPHPRSPYAESKLSAERACQNFTYGYGFETICLRYFSVFGPRQSLQSPYIVEIPRFIENSMRGEALTVYGDGEQSQDFTYVSNVVEANLLAARVRKVVPGRVFNIGCGLSLCLNEVIEHLCGVLGERGAVEYVEAHSLYDGNFQADIRRAEGALGYRPSVQATEGLARFVGWYRQSG